VKIDSEEIFDVVDECDRIIGQAPRSKVHQEGLLHRAVHVFATNPSEEIFLQRRALTKDVAPGLWSSSCSGHVDAGETYEQATLRELVEEIGLSLEPCELRLRLMVSPCSATENEFVRLYHCRANPPLRIDPGEVMDGRWLTKAELEKRIQSEPEAFSPSFLHLYAFDCLLIRES
tara:strand:+ start:403 stop:927 length:525 start_codon:yes stop_codon:yes gene_type:complete